MEGKQQQKDESAIPAQARQEEKRPQSKHAANEHTAMVTGFVIILVLMFLIISIGLGRMAAIQGRLNTIVDNHLVKIKQVHQMRVGSRERTVLLQQMLLLKDAFERDEVWMRFNAQGTKFMEARAVILSMELSLEEIELMHTMDRFVDDASSIQNDVVESIMGEKPSNVSRELLITDAVPAQNRVLALLIELTKLQEKTTNEAAHQAAMAYTKARGWMIFLSACAFGLALLIAYLVIRQSKRARDTLASEKEKAQVTLHSIGDGVITTDAKGSVEYINSVAARLTGWDQGESLGKPLKEIFSLSGEASEAETQGLIDSAIALRQPVTISGETKLTTKSGHEYIIEATAAPIVGSAEQILGTVVVFRDVTEMHTLSNQLRYRASHDDMTGLLNRSEFESQLQHAINTARTEGSEHAFCFIDLDLFKIVNDSSGHAAGDELLRQISSLLKKHVRRNDVLARLGGDEFAILLGGCSIKRAEEIANKIRQEVYSFRFVWEDKSYQLGVSIGVVTVSAMSGTVSDVLKAGDVALSLAKEQGRNLVHVLGTEQGSVAERETEVSWVERIHNSLDNNGFQLYAQRIISLDDSEPDQYEILLRMTDEDGGVIAPGAFLPAAERYQMMPRIDRWVVRRALKTLGQHFGPGSEVGMFSINLSGQSLGDRDFVKFLYEQLDSTAFNLEMVCFEITETTAIANLSVASQLMSDVKKRGCKFSLDDFGSGLSSFAYLKGLAVDNLKIDGSLVKDIAKDEASRAMVKSINEVAHALGLKTVAEYLENDELISLARSIGIDYGQGYGIAKPVPLDSVIELYEKTRQPKESAVKR